MLVVDASVVVKFFVPENGSANALRVLGHEPNLIAPAQCFAEVAETLVRKIRSGQLGEFQISQLAPSLAEMVSVSSLDYILSDAMRIAQETAGQAVYDCLCVALAAAENCGFVTADRRLIAKMAGTPNAGLLMPLDSFSGSP